ncbi:unnamed protein product [Ceratitis capitata]|uniref:(Mediterranean fruit fly) hypothetical protein n=1 Tax=Ceratitis capitata TaxID=7213 RepID=A0A811UJC9_CERCA|nr:unnamed protein product [Ceratitis capitata]
MKKCNETTKLLLEEVVFPYSTKQLQFATVRSNIETFFLLLSMQAPLLPFAFIRTHTFESLQFFVPREKYEEKSEMIIKNP